MKDLIALFEACNKLGYNLDDLTLDEGMTLLRDFKLLVNETIINSTNK
jgi:hypothetical protein